MYGITANFNLLRNSLFAWSIPMREFNKSVSLFAVFAFMLIYGINANAQGMGGHGWHNGYHGMDWPDTLRTITVSGTVRVDSLKHVGFMHNLDYQHALYFWILMATAALITS
jgi:hypothetical protein